MGLSQARMAETLGIKQPSYASYESGGAMPSAAVLSKLAIAHGVSVDWLLTGEGEMSRNALSRQDTLRVVSPPLVERSRVVYDSLPGDALRIPVYDLSAGSGMEPNGELIESEGQAMRAWLREEVGMDPDTAFLARVHGDSMTPMLKPGDWALGRLQDDYQGEGVYALWYEGDFYVKTLERRGTRNARMISLNPAYDPVFIHEGDQIKILGRVMRRFTGLY